jgi:phenylpropionate dioxygenase-like ring-hydroxylating dioxygenase large terminal subunit
MLDGNPLVLFRTKDGVTALTDRCPHRLVELSNGRVIEGQIECPYHGWRFGAAGVCTAIPGHVGDLPQVRVKQWAVHETEGAIFASDGDPGHPPYVHCAVGQKIITRLVRSNTQSTVIDAAENILDATHTHFTHKGLLRGLGEKRVTVDVKVTGGAGWVEACYTGEDKQQGFISRTLEGTRTRTIGRFRAPGIAELEYWGPDGLTLATTFHLRQTGPNRVDGIGWLIGPDHGVGSQLKALAFKPMFALALHQDRRVLASASRNAAQWPNAKPAIGPLDFLRRDIAAIMAGNLPECADMPKTYQIQL